MSEDDEYYQHTLAILEQSYLDADARGDAAGGSGSGGGLDRWEKKRRVLAQAFERDGSWLDIGCANGLLMETIARWTAENGVHVEPYGLDLSARIVAVARQRLPHWAGRIRSGNVMTWEPPRRFDYVTVLADCVPPARRRDLIDRLLTRFLHPRGRLVFSIYVPHPPEPPAEPLSASDVLRRFGYEVAGEAESRIDGQPKVSTAWIDTR